jgi:outer membrane protein TolC
MSPSRLAILGALVVSPLAVPVAPLWAQTVDTSSATQTLTLGGAARLAARRSAHALEATERARQARARTQQSRAAFLPNADALFTPVSTRTYNIAPQLGISFNIPGVPAIFDPKGQVVGPVNDINYGVRASDTLFSLGALARLRSARARQAAEEADASQQADSAASAAADVYLETQRTEAQLAARIADSTLASDLLGIANDQLQAGVGISLDVTRAQAQLSTVRAQLIQARNDVDRASLDLLRTLGLALDTHVTLTDSLAGLPYLDSLASEDRAVDQAFARRPDLRSTELQLEAADRQIGAIQSERLPSISAYGAYAEDGIYYSVLLPTYTVGVQVTFPIFDGLRREGRIEEQRAVAREVEVRRRDLRQKVAIQVRRAYLDLSSTRQQVAATDERQRLATQEVEQARERFRAGVAGNADVITAEQDVDAARTAYIDAVYNYQLARVSLAEALGAVQDLP